MLKKMWGHILVSGFCFWFFLWYKAIIPVCYWDGYLSLHGVWRVLSFSFPFQKLKKMYKKHKECIKEWVYQSKPNYTGDRVELPKPRNTSLTIHIIMWDYRIHYKITPSQLTCVAYCLAMWRQVLDAIRV